MIKTKQTEFEKQRRMHTWEWEAERADTVGKLITALNRLPKDTPVDSDPQVFEYCKKGNILFLIGDDNA